MSKLLRVLTLAFIITTFEILTLHTLPAKAATNNTYSNVIINELLPNPVGSDSLYEWIELYNTTNEQIDLSDWEIQGESLSGVIEPFEFLIVARDQDAMLEIYPDINFIQIPISLKNSGDTIELVNAEDEITDLFAYENAEEGKSFERVGIPNLAEECDGINLNQDYHTLGKVNLVVVSECWIGDDEIVESEEFEISNIQFSFDGVDYYDTIYSYGETQLEISFEINFPESGVQNIKYFTENGEQLANPITIDNYYNQKIRVEVELSSGENVSGHSNEIFIYPLIQFTEIYYGDSNWIEVYNPNAVSVDLDGYKLVISNEELLFTELASSCGTAIEPETFCTFLIPEFELPATFEMQIEGMTMQSLGIETLEKESSVSSYQGAWVTDLNSTPGLENKPLDSSIIISEVYPSPNTGETEWLELYNTSNYEIDLSGWYLTETVSNGICALNTKFPDVAVDGNNFLVLEQNALKVSLNNSGDEIYLCNGENQVISEVIYPEISKGISYSRLTNNKGEFIGDFGIASTPTPGSFNEFPVGNSGDPVEEATADPIDINSVSNVHTLDGKLIYAEGEIIGNYGSSFDIQTSKGILRVGFSNIDTPERSKGDFVKVTGLLEVDGDTLRIYPQSNDDLIIIPKVEEKKTSATKSSSSKTSSISSGSKVATVAGLKSYPKLPKNLFDTQDFSNSSLISNSPEKDMRFLLAMVIAAIILVLYAIYITELDKRFINYIKIKHEEKISYFKTNIKKKNFPRRAVDYGPG